MHHDYADIRSRIEEDPKWFDECAVPRYEPFSPKHLADIYADECALVRIQCQGCQRRFRVAFSISSMARIRAVMNQMAGQQYDQKEAEKYSIANQIKEKTIHYGDPPNVRCCAAGPTMNSDPLLVLEYWERKNFDWVRNPEYEINLDDND